MISTPDGHKHRKLMKYLSRKIIVLTLCISFFKNSNVQAQYLFNDTNACIHDRITNLLEVLTLEEKISLLTQTAPAIPRLGIKKYYHGNEALHGVVRPGKFTVFPQAIGLAATWNPDLIYEVATAISDEARARWNELDWGDKQTNQYSDLLTFWSPTINMARDPRWGRTAETYGEDPYLTGRIAVSFVKGLQGNHRKYLKAVSTPKHFVANNEEHNRLECNAIISEKDLREYYLAAFEDCIREGKAQAIMSAYNAINDVPCTANKWLLTDVLRKEWGFNGYVVSDCGAPSFLVTHHNYVKTEEEAAKVAIEAGLDLECGHKVFTQPLLNAVKLGMVTTSQVDTAAYRVLRGRMLLGLFDDPRSNPYNFIPPSVVGNKEHQQLALETARQSLVLLKNRDHFLPLRSGVKKIAVVGINADKCEFGDYSGEPLNKPVSVLQGIKNYAGKNTEILSAPWIVFTNEFEIISSTFFGDSLQAEYFDNSNLEGTPRIRREENIHFNPAQQPPDAFIPKGNKSIRWTGVLTPQISGKYEFSFTSDDGFRIFINNERIVDKWIVRSETTDHFNVFLEVGKPYHLVVEYFDAGGSASAILKWKIPENKEQKELLLQKSLELAEECDVAIAVMGINKLIEREGKDRESIRLPEDQEDFIKQLVEANPKVVLVLIAGSSLAIPWMNDHIPAILNAWYPGEQGGNAVAEAIFGYYNPGGKLPLTYYKSLDDLPPFNDYDLRNERTYKFFKKPVLYPFGHGLSYTDFEYSDLQIVNKNDSIEISCNLKNKGNYDGDEVVQVYFSKDQNDNNFPIRELKAFKRCHIPKGYSQKVTILVDKNKLRYFDENSKQWHPFSGVYQIAIGSSSDDLKLIGKLTF